MPGCREEDDMSHDVPPLTPFPLGVLLDRIEHEWSTRNRIFDLPTARFFDVSDGPDLSTDFMGRPAATPIGPAAGPHSQLAENIVLSWLGGARIFELKTVQILDELEISRPCIDMETVGYNIEWSQELRIPESLEEYVKAWMIIEMLRGWDELTPHLGSDPGPHVFDLSVGYDLAGISTDRVAGFIDGLIDATAEIERLRAEIGGVFAPWRDHDFPTRIADTVTLSTFHGCPPDEIEAISKHLMTRHGLDVVVKLNPTLLGFDIIGELERFAAAAGRRFGIKLTNTLVVENHRGVLPDDPMYLSGPPLHVVSTTLLGALDDALPGRLRVEGGDGPIQVSFSAGITKENFPDTASLGLAPVTVCSDLLKPGGYGRIKPMLKALQGEIETAGVPSLAGLIAARGPGSVDSYVARLHDPEHNGAYTREGTSKLPRQVDHVLEMWGCVACNFCVTVCPNDAFFKLPTAVEGMEGRQQYFVFTELCNECGNCMTFCPEEGDPAVVKPRLFLDPIRFAAVEGQAFLLQGDGEITITAKEGFEDQIAPLAATLAQIEGVPLTAGALGD
jgi:putative selenate reductase